jgi:hypothetical protein
MLNSEPTGICWVRPQEDTVTQNAPEDGRIALTPISRPDPGRREHSRRGRKLVAGAVAVVVVAGGVTWWAVAAHQHHKPVKHTATVPHSFDGYTRSADGGSMAAFLAGANTDPAKGVANFVYQGSGGHAALITVQLDPPHSKSAYEDSPDASDGALSRLTGDGISTGHPRTYPAGHVGGTISCSTVKVTRAKSSGALTRCEWKTSAADVTLVPVRDGHTVTDADAPTLLRSFLAALHIKPAP